MDWNIQGAASAYQHLYRYRQGLEDRGVHCHGPFRCRRRRCGLRLHDLSLNFPWQGISIAFRDTRQGAEWKDRVLPVHGRHVCELSLV